MVNIEIIEHCPKGPADFMAMNSFYNLKKITILSDVVPKGNIYRTVFKTL